jgi:hypothetical protein
VIEAHAQQRPVELGDGVLVRVMLPPQLVGDRHVVARPAGGTEQLSEHHLRVAGGHRRGARLVVVARIVEEVDPRFHRRSHDRQTVVA